MLTLSESFACPIFRNVALVPSYYRMGHFDSYLLLLEKKFQRRWESSVLVVFNSSGEAMALGNAPVLRPHLPSMYA